MAAPRPRVAVSLQHSQDLVYDDKTYPSATADCNLWIPSGVSAMMTVAGTDGASDVSYRTLDEIRSRTPLERNSMALPASKWTDGTLFRNFSSQSSADFDFTPVNPSRSCSAARSSVRTRHGGRFRAATTDALPRKVRTRGGMTVDV